MTRQRGHTLAALALSVFLPSVVGTAAAQDILRGRTGSPDILGGGDPQADILRGPTPSADILRGNGTAAALDERPDPALCRALIAHRPVSGVEHTPGVDGRGRPVAPADLPGGGAASLVGFQMPVTVDFLRRFGLPVPRSAAALPRGAEVGRLGIDGNRVLFNGQPLGDPAVEQLYVACGQAR